MKKQENLETILDSGVVAVIRGMEPGKIVKVATALEKGGVKALEITFDSLGAAEMVKEVKQQLQGKEAIVGAGTVLDGETAQTAIRAGAEFVFGPTFSEEMVKVCNRYGKVAIPGALTPTEVLTAYQSGADLVKVFPAASMGPNYFNKVKGPLPQVPLMATGGVNLDNAPQFIEAGVEAVGVGSALLDKQAIKEENYEVLTEKARQFIQAVKK
jgi:2-dehydro-3-deoxyphosphogluconate aldolase/(4S)-4-hydroxy-2-oxoglutarate aldolase